MGSKRLFAVKEIEKLLRNQADLVTAAATAIGGGAVLSTNKHALDGPEHSAATETDQKLATDTHSGLLLPLSGDPDDRLAGDGSWQPESGGAVFGTPAVVLGTAAAAGSVDEVIRRDATIVAFDATAPTTQALGDSAAVGSVAMAARRDHKHAMPAAAVTASGLTQATARLLGRTTAATGAIEEINVGSGLSLSAGSLSATGGSTTVATDAIWDAAGDLAVGTGADTAARLAKGSDGQVLTVDPTTHLLVWATPKTVATDSIWDAKGDLAAATGADAASKLVVGTNGYVLTADSTQSTGLKWAAVGTGGTSGVSWNQDVNESGASLANWTTVSGTWSSSGTIIQHTNVTGSWNSITYTTLIALGFPLIAEAEMRFPTSGQGTGSFVQGGFFVGSLGLILDYNSQQTLIEDWQIQNFRTPATTIVLDTWYKFRVVMSGDWVSWYRDGTLIGTTRTSGNVNADKFGLGGYNSKMDYRNIKLWTLSGGAPA